MMEKIIYYSFAAWKENKFSNFLYRDSLDLYAANLNTLIYKIKFYNRSLFFKRWTSVTFYKWALTLVDGEEMGHNIIDTCYSPKFIDEHKIKVWGENYEI